MHDIRGLEELGVASVGIATTEFVDAAQLQNKALGYDPAVVYVAHPIQDRTTGELQALADKAFEDILKAVSA
jgi:hypothetical protein